MPPLFRMSQGGKTVYAHNDADRDRLLKSEFRAGAKVENCFPLQGVGRNDAGAIEGNHHGPGQAHAAARGAAGRRPRRHGRLAVERLMGTKAEARFAFISDRAEFASEDLLDV